MNDQFAESLFHKEHIVCGVRLYPYTFAHAALLDFAKSPYCALSGQASLDDIVFALAVLQSPGQFPIALPELSNWRKKRLIKSVFEVGLIDAHNALLHYFTDYGSAPSIWQTEGSRSVKTPWMLYFVALLIRHGKKTEAEAWETEVGYGRWLCAALSEAGGNDISIVTDAERAALKEAGHGG